jgi:hypothetical protein
VRPAIRRLVPRRFRTFPNPAALLRLAGAVLVEAWDERQVSDRRYLSRLALVSSRSQEVAPAQLMPAWSANADPHGGLHVHHAAGRHLPDLGLGRQLGRADPCWPASMG